jgi:hypothetical protein
MLRDKLKISVTRKSAIELRDSIVSRVFRIDTTNGALCLLCLDKFCQKLLLIYHDIELRKGKKTVSLNKQEQLAIHIGYKQKYWDTANIYLQEVFTEIDKTL